MLTVIIRRLLRDVRQSLLWGKLQSLFDDTLRAITYTAVINPHTLVLAALMEIYLKNDWYPIAAPPAHGVGAMAFFSRQYELFASASASARAIPRFSSLWVVL